MRTEKVNFYSEGIKLAGVLYLPQSDQGKPFPGIVQGPGFLGLKDAKHYIMMFEKLCEAGYACLCFDYRGWGDSEGGERGWVMPKWQAEDIRSAITYMQTRAEIDPDRIATYGSGGTGGGNAVYVAAIDSRVKCCVSYLGVSSGRDWLHSMRREYEWVDYLKSIEEDRKKRVTHWLRRDCQRARGDHGRKPRSVKQPPLKKKLRIKIPDAMPLACAEAILEYSPIDVVHKISPRGALFIAVEGDAVTPEQQSFDLYEKAGEPKKLILYKKTTHYGIYNDYFDDVAANVIDWYNRHLKYHKVEITEKK